MKRYSLIVQDFATSQVCEKWSKTLQNFIIGFFSIKVTKNSKKTRGDMFYTFTSLMSHTLNAKLREIWSNHHKTLYNTLFPRNYQKSGIKTGVKLWPQFPLK